jgi:hypothetical protein
VAIQLGWAMRISDVLGKRKVFSPAAFAQIISLVEQGLPPAEIARQIGCTLGSLRVKCSQHGISLRGGQTGIPKLARLNMQLSHEIALRLREQAKRAGVTDKEYAVQLIQAIVQDNLYDAVMDGVD